MRKFHFVEVMRGGAENDAGCFPLASLPVFSPMKISIFLGLPKPARREYNMCISRLSVGGFTEKGYCMELIVIGESRLKIMLTGEDMARYELTEPDPTGQNANSITPHTREVLRHIFADAHSEIGFDTEGERLFVQLYASKGGGCEIFVTKLGEGETKLLKCLSTCEKTEAARNCRVGLRMDSLADLTALCRRLLSVGYGGESELYIIEEGGAATWLLILMIPEGRDTRSPFPFLIEYGESVNRDAETYAAEHGRLICRGNAVETMAKI